MIRSANIDEIDVFYELWREFLLEHREFADIPPDPIVMNEYGSLFQAYIGGSRAGCCLFWVDDDGNAQGVVLSGEPLNKLDIPGDLGRCGILYGIYIRKEYRRTHAGVELMRASALSDYTAGLENGLTMIRPGNEAALGIMEHVGAKLVDMRYSMNLGKLGGL